MTTYQEMVMRAALRRHDQMLETRQQATGLVRIPTKRDVRQASRGVKQDRRREQPDSMLNMPRPAHHRPIPLWADERTKAQMARHQARRAAGWIRG